jgi:hypothetical protein
MSKQEGTFDGYKKELSKLNLKTTLLQIRQNVAKKNIFL